MGGNPQVKLVLIIFNLFQYITNIISTDGGY